MDMTAMRARQKIAFTAFAPEHLAGIVPQAAQEGFAAPGTAELLAVPGLSWTGLWQGRVVGCAGVLPVWDGRAKTWAILDARFPRSQWIRTVAKIRRTLARAHALGYARIEADIDAEFVNGHRLARGAGFAPEAVMEGYAPGGRDVVRYVWAPLRGSPKAQTEEAA